jgi:hypothetical protein
VFVGPDRSSEQVVKTNKLKPIARMRPNTKLNEKRQKLMSIMVDLAAASHLVLGTGSDP